MTLEQTIQPFQGEQVGPDAYVPPGTVGVPPALVQIGLKGGTKTFTGDYSYQRATKIGAVHKESSTPSHKLTSNCGDAAAANSAKANQPGVWQ